MNSPIRRTTTRRIPCEPRMIGAALALAIVSGPSFGDAQGDSPTIPPGEGWLFQTLFGTDLHAADRTDIYGFVQTGFSRNNEAHGGPLGAGHANFPVVGPSDENLQFNALELFVDRKIQGDLTPRVTPLPGPVPDQISWGVFLDVLWGRNGQAALLSGLETRWEVNAPGATSPALATRDRQNFLAIPNSFAQVYLPYGKGMAITAGRFSSAIGYETPPALRTSPNFFYSKTYAFVAQPNQVLGALFSANVTRDEHGLTMAELGIVRGWQNWTDDNDARSLIGALRWRANDMTEGLDYEFITGDEQNSSKQNVEAPVHRVISPRGQNRQHHSLNGYVADGPWKLSGELAYGRQDGDGRRDTIDIVTGPGFRGAQYGGVNAQLVLQIQPDLAGAVRLEHFRDPEGFALYPATAVPSDFNAATIGVRYDASRFLSLRPELRYDWQDNNHGLAAFGFGHQTRQTTFSIDALVYF